MSRTNKNFLNHAWPVFRRCQWCLKPLEREEATADHIVPSSKGGSDSWYNLLVSCYDCNHNRMNRKVMSKQGAWLDDRIPKPHGPRWHGPHKSPKKPIVVGCWCECHVPVPQRIAITSSSQDEAVTVDAAPV